MTVRDLNRDCLIELKQAYMAQLVDDGSYGEVMHNDDSITEPSWGELAAADELIDDEFIFEHYDEMEFEPDDFFCLVRD